MAEIEKWRGRDSGLGNILDKLETRSRQISTWVGDYDLLSHQSVRCASRIFLDTAEIEKWRGRVSSLGNILDKPESRSRQIITWVGDYDLLSPVSRSTSKSKIGGSEIPV